MAEELGSMIYSVKMELDDTQLKGGVDDLKAQFSDMGKQASSEFNKAFFNDRQLVDAGYNSYQNPLFFMREYYKTQSQQIKDAVRRASNTAEEHYSGLETSSPLARRIANTQYQSALRNAHNAFSDTAIVRDLAHSFIQDFSDQLKDSNLSQILSASVDGITKQILTKVNHSVGINYKARQLADYVAGEQGGEFQKLVGNLSRAGYADSAKMATRFTELIAKARVAPYRQYENMVNKPVTASNFYTSFSSMLPNNVKKVFQEYDKITKFDHGDSPAISDKVMQKLTARAQTDAYLLNTMKRLGMARITNGRAALATNLTNRDLGAIVGSLLEETVDAAKGMQMYGITKASQLDDPDYVEKVIRKQNQRIRGFRDTLSYMDSISSGSAGYVPARYRAADVRAIRRNYGANTFAAPYVDLRRRFEVPYYNMSDIVIGKDGKARTQHDWMKEIDSSLDNWERFHHETIDESLAVNAILAKSGQRELRNNALMRGIIKIKHPDNYLDMSKAEQKQIDDMFANMVDNGLYIKGKKNPMVLASLSNGEMTFVDKPIKDKIENDPKYGKGFFYSGVNPNTKISYKDLISILNHGAKAFSGAYNTEEGLGVDTSQFNPSNVLVVAGKTFGKNNVTTGLDGSSWISKDILGKAGQARALGMKYVLSTLDFGAMRDAYGYDLPVLLAGATDSRQYGKVTANTKAVINMSDIKDFEERFLNVDKNGNWTWKDRKDANGNVIGKWDYNSMVNEVIQKDLRQIYMMRTAEEAEKSLSFIPGQSAGMLSMTAQEVRQNIDRYKEIMRKLDTPEGVKQYVLAGTSDENLAADLSEGLLGTEKYQRKVAEFKQSLRTHLLKNDIIVPEGITALSRMAMPYPVDFFNKMIDIYNNDQSVGNKLQLNDEIKGLTLGENGVYAPGIQGNISMNRSPSALGSWVTAQNLLNSEKVREELKKDPKKLAQIMGMDEKGVFLSPGSVLLEYLQSADFDGDMLSIYSTATDDMLDKITDANQRTSIVSFKNMIDRTIAQHNKLFERAYNYEKGNLTQEQIDSIENRPDEMSDALWSVIRPARIRKALNKHYEDVYAKQIDDLPDELKGDINLSSPGRAVAQYLALVKKQSLSLGVPNAIGINGFNIGALSDKEAVALVQALTHYDIDSTMAKKTQYFQNTGEESSLLLNRTFGQLGGKIKNMRNERGDLDASKIHKNLSIDDLLRMSVPNSQASGAYLTSWLARSALAARFGDDGLGSMADTLIANAADESGVTKESAPALSKLRQSLLRVFRGQFSGEFVKVADQAMVDFNKQFEEATKEYNANKTKGKATPYAKAYLTAKDTYMRLMNQQNTFQTEDANQTGDRFNAAVGKNIYTSREDLLSDADAKAIADAVTSEPDKLTLNSKRYSVLRELETTAADEIYKKWFGNTSTRKVSFSMLTGLANGYQTPIDWANYLLTGATSDTEATRAGKAVEAAIEQYFKTGKTEEAIKTLEGQYDDASNRLSKNNGYYDVNKSFIQNNLGKIYSDLGLQYERSQLHVRLPGLGVDAKTTVGLPDELFTKDGKLYIGDIKNYKGGTDADTEKFHQMQLALYGGAQYKWSEIKDVAQRLNPALKKSKWNDESYHTLSEMGIELGGMFTMNPTTGIGSIHQYKADAETIASEYGKAGSMLSAIKQMISSKGSGHLTEKDIADLGVDLRKIMGIVTEAQAEALKTGNEYTATAQTEFGIGQDTITSALRADRAMVEADNRVAAIRKSMRPVDKNQRYYYSYGQKIRDLESDIELYESMRSTIGDVATTNRIQNAQQTINDIKMAAPGIASMAYTDFINSVNNNQAGVKEIKSLSAISSQFNTIATSIQEADDAYNVFVDGLTDGVVYDADKYEKLKQELETKENDRKATKKKKEKRELTNEINSITEQMNAMDKAKAAMDLGGLGEVTRLKDLAHEKLGEQFNRTASDYDVAVAKMLNNILDVSGTQHGLSRNDYIQNYKSSLASVAAELDSSLKNFKGSSEQQQILQEYVDNHLKRINNATTEDAVNAAADAYEEYERTHNAYNNRLDELEDQRYATQRRRQFVRNTMMPQRYITTLGQSFGRMYALRELYSQAIEDNTLGKLEAETRLNDFMHEHGATTREELAAQNTPNTEKNVATYDALTKQIRNYSNALGEAEAAQAQFSGGTGVVTATVQGIASSFENLMSRFGYRAFMTVINNIKNFVKQYEASLTEIQMITLKSDSEMAAVSDNNMSMARSLNTNALQVSQIQAGLYRQGLSDSEVNERTAAVIKLSRVSGINTNTASKIITTALQNGLVEDAEEAIDVLGALGDSAATTADEIQKALQKTAASAANAGVSYQELTAILTAAISKTQLSGNVVGTAFSTIMTRMRKISETGYVKAANGEVTKANDVSSALSRVGVKVFEGNQMRNVVDILLDLASVWNSIDSDLLRQHIVYSMAGRGANATNTFYTIMDAMGEDGEFAKLLGIAQGAGGTVNAKYDLYTDSFIGSMEALKGAFQEWTDSVVNSGFVGGLVDFTTALLQAAAAIPGWMNLIEVAAAALVAAFTKAAIAAKVSGIMNAADKAGTTVGMGTQLLGSFGGLIGLAAGLGSYLLFNGINGVISNYKEEKLLAEQIKNNREETRNQYALEQMATRKHAMQGVVDVIEDLLSKQIVSSDQLKEGSTELSNYSKAISELNKVIGPELATDLLNASDGVVNFSNAIVALKDEIHKFTAEEYKELARQSITENEPYVKQVISTKDSIGVAGAPIKFDDYSNITYDFLSRILPTISNGWGLNIAQGNASVFGDSESIDYSILRNNAVHGQFERVRNVHQQAGLGSIRKIANAILETTGDQKQVDEFTSSILEWLGPFATPNVTSALSDILNSKLISDYMGVDNTTPELALGIAGRNMYALLNNNSKFKTYLKYAGYDMDELTSDFPKFFMDYYMNSGELPDTADEIWTFFTDNFLPTFDADASALQTGMSDYIFKSPTGETLFNFSKNSKEYLTDDDIIKAIENQIVKEQAMIDESTATLETYAEDENRVNELSNEIGAINKDVEQKSSVLDSLNATKSGILTESDSFSLGDQYIPELQSYKDQYDATVAGLTDIIVKYPDLLVGYVSTIESSNSRLKSLYNAYNNTQFSDKTTREYDSQITAIQNDIDAELAKQKGLAEGRNAQRDLLQVDINALTVEEDKLDAYKIDMLAKQDEYDDISQEYITAMKAVLNNLEGSYEGYLEYQKNAPQKAYEDLQDFAYRVGTYYGEMAKAGLDTSGIFEYTADKEGITSEAAREKWDMYLSIADIGGPVSFDDLTDKQRAYFINSIIPYKSEQENKFWSIYGDLLNQNAANGRLTRSNTELKTLAAQYMVDGSAIAIRRDDANKAWRAARTVYGDQLNKVNALKEKIAGYGDLGDYEDLNLFQLGTYTNDLIEQYKTLISGLESDKEKYVNGQLSERRGKIIKQMVSELYPDADTIIKAAMGEEVENPMLVLLDYMIDKSVEDKAELEAGYNTLLSITGDIGEEITKHSAEFQTAFGDVFTDWVKLSVATYKGDSTAKTLVMGTMRSNILGALNARIEELQTELESLDADLTTTTTEQNNLMNKTYKLSNGSEFDSSSGINEYIANTEATIKTLTRAKEAIESGDVAAQDFVLRSDGRPLDQLMTTIIESWMNTGRGEAAKALTLTSSVMSNPESTISDVVSVLNKQMPDVDWASLGFEKAPDVNSDMQTWYDTLYAKIFGRTPDEFNKEIANIRSQFGTRQRVLNDIDNVKTLNELEDKDYFVEAYKALYGIEPTNISDLMNSKGAIQDYLNRGYRQSIDSMIYQPLYDLMFNSDDYANYMKTNEGATLADYYNEQRNKNTPLGQLFGLMSGLGVSISDVYQTPTGYIPSLNYTGVTPVDAEDILTYTAKTPEYMTNLARNYMNAWRKGTDWFIQYKNGLLPSEQEYIKRIAPELVELTNLNDLDSQYAKNLERKVEIQFATSGLDQLEEAGEILEGMTQNVQNILSADIGKSFKGMYDMAQGFAENQRALDLYEKALTPGAKLTQEEWNTIGKAFGIADMTPYQTGMFDIENLRGVANVQRGLLENSAWQTYSSILSYEEEHPELNGERSKQYEDLMKQYGYVLKNGKFEYDITEDKSGEFTAEKIMSDRAKMMERTADMYDQTSTMFALYDLFNGDNFAANLELEDNAQLKSMWNSMVKSGTFDRYLGEGGAITDMDAVRRILFEQAYGINTKSYRYNENADVRNVINGLLNRGFTAATYEDMKTNMYDYERVMSAASSLLGSDYERILNWRMENGNAELPPEMQDVVNNATRVLNETLLADAVQYSKYGADIEQVYKTLMSGTASQQLAQAQGYAQQRTGLSQAMWAINNINTGNMYDQNIMSLITSATGYTEEEVRKIVRSGNKSALSGAIQNKIADLQNVLFEAVKAALPNDSVLKAVNFGDSDMLSKLRSARESADEGIQSLIDILLEISNLGDEAMYKSFAEQYEQNTFGNRRAQEQLMRLWGMRTAGPEGTTYDFAAMRHYLTYGDLSRTENGITYRPNNEGYFVDQNGQYLMTPNENGILERTKAQGNTENFDQFIQSYLPLATLLATNPENTEMLDYYMRRSMLGATTADDNEWALNQIFGSDIRTWQNMSTDDWQNMYLSAKQTNPELVQAAMSQFPELQNILEATGRSSILTTEAIQALYDTLNHSDALDMFGKAGEEASAFMKDLASNSKNAAKTIGDLVNKETSLAYRMKTLAGAKGKKGSQLSDDEIAALELTKGTESLFSEADIARQIELAENGIQNTFFEEGAPEIMTMLNDAAAQMAPEIRVPFKVAIETLIENNGGTAPVDELAAICEQYGVSLDGVLLGLVGTGSSIGIQVEATDDQIGWQFVLNQLRSATHVGSAGGKKTGGGGGGGGKSKLQKYLEKWAKKFAVYDHEIKMIQYQETKYQNAGELSNYGAMIELENEAQLRYISNLEKAISGIKGKMKTLEKESDDWYAAREAVMKYEEQIEAANQAIRDNTKKLEENQQAIYKTRTDLEDLVRSEADTREKTRRDILSATVSMEETILEAIRKRYQDEWDLIKRDIDRKRNALEEEKNLINERLQARKDAEQEAEKYEQLAEYQRQLAYVSMDPTRTKDALELQHKIDELQKELAWTTAEREAQAQQEAIDDQIEAYDQFAQIGDEDLAAYIEDANNFTEQVKALLEGSQEELMSWLKANVDEYKLALDEQQQNMVESWTDTWKTMMHITETWAELIVEILTGRDSFMNYMMQSDEYQLATPEMREQLYYKWDEMWNDYINSRITGATYSHTDDWMGVGTSGSSSSSSGGGSGSTTTQTVGNTIGSEGFKQEGVDWLSPYGDLLNNTVSFTKPHGYSFLLNGQTYQRAGFASSAEARNAALALIDSIISGQHLSDMFRQQALGTLSAFKAGGLADYTGLAWVDGTKARPEAFLSADDTKLMRGFLNAARYVSVAATMTTIPDDMFTGNNGQNIEAVNITINEATINDDMDIQELAEKIGSSFIKELSINGVNSSKYSY